MSVVVQTAGHPDGPISNTRRVRSALGPAARAARPDLERQYPEIFAGSRRDRLTTIGVVVGLVGLFAFALWRLDFSFARIGSGLVQLAHFTTLMLPPSSGTVARFWLFLNSLGETLAIAFLGTLAAATFAFPFGFLAAKNVVPQPLVHFFTRRGLDTIRGVDTLIWALIWINVVGLGPFAGILAIMCSDFGAFGKLFSEAIESVDGKPIEGVVSTGGSRLAQIRFAILPQILPVIAGQVLYYFESNTRSATIIGIVGAGGIGLWLTEAIRTLEWQQVSLLVLMILVAVAAIDQISARIRFAIIGDRRLDL
ncbi:phosphonate ABC transporter, permease protein PhnE [Siculibacillus lacustris]|uniref:Phosphonate ABC transporter, permease protein PhnE n=1 Tax=Siculibacillus lacustris TaxID=1549641 RepID=A0A4Q9VPC8_9HYPH|nr:phosphonate ABC transporter, permease protein PhnE [Siculibacillus lacustris]TBW37588.1 phosphonate ABC transporter, permease protein PhnE [Siculibacillus lacustris]